MTTDLYKSPDVADRIKIRAGDLNLVMKNVLAEAGVGSNAMSHMKHGKAMAFDSLAKIADVLECSVDYLLGRTDNPEINR